MPDRDLSSLSNIDPSRLSLIWPGSAPATAGGPASDPAAAFRRRLDARLADVPQPLAAAAAAGEVVGGAANAGSVRADPAEPATVGQLLADPAPSADVLKRVKEWAKPAMRGTDAGWPREAAGVLYYAAIVVAWARAGAWITDLSPERVRQGARWSLGRSWLDEPTAGLFREGLVTLEGRGGPPDQGG